MKPTVALTICLTCLSVAATVHHAVRASGPAVMKVANSDPKMTAAVAHARATTGRFLNALKHPKRGQYAFSFKYRVPDPSDPSIGENIWLSNVTFGGAKLHGTVADGDEPVHILTVHIGDHITESPKRITDWMYMDGKKLRGGYTMRVMYIESSPQERAQMLRETGYTDADLRASD